MKTLLSNKTWLAAGLAILISLVGCGSQSTQSTPIADTSSGTSTTSAEATSTETTTSTASGCDITLKLASVANLKAFLPNQNVSNLEGKATICLNLKPVSGARDENITGTFNLSFEDEFGVSTTDDFQIAVNTTGTYSGKALEIYFEDSYGIVRVKGTVDSNNYLAATISYRNFDLKSTTEAQTDYWQQWWDWYAAAYSTTVKPTPPATATSLPQWMIDWQKQIQDSSTPRITKVKNFINSSETKTLGSFKVELWSVLDITN